MGLLYLYLYSFCMLCTKFHVARTQTKCYQNCPCHIKGRAGLLKNILRKEVHSSWQPRLKHGECELKEMGQVVLQVESSGTVLTNLSLKDEKKVKKIT